MEFVTDRTESDVLLENKKGFYTFDDLNRVEQTVAELAEKAGLHADVKTDWGTPGAFDFNTWPVDREMCRFLKNVQDLCVLFGVDHFDLPATMECLNWKSANAIEESLEETARRIHNMVQSYHYSGEIFAVEEILL